MRPAIVSGMVTGDSLVSYWPISSLFLVTVPDVFAKDVPNLYPFINHFSRKRQLFRIPTIKNATS